MSGFSRALAVGAWLVVATGCGPSADETLLAGSWATYRATFISPEGRVVRPEHEDDTVSEGQAYAMLRAAWMDDRATFNRVWHWTRANLGRTGKPWPSLLAWRWSSGTGVRDWNVASDADADVALALLIAASQWPADAAAYREAALAITRDLIDHSVVTDDTGLLVFLPGAWADQRHEGRGIVLNPSYLAPASFRLFHHATGDARWLQLAENTYDVLDATCERPPATLPPDWVRWSSREDWAADDTLGGQPGWDAIRVPWRIATDVQWFQSSRGRSYLARCLEPFVRLQVELHRGLAVEYDTEGRPLGSEDHPLANALYSFALRNPSERDLLLAHAAGQMTRRGRELYLGESDRYYTNSLAYLPFLARAGGHRAP